MNWMKAAPGAEPLALPLPKNVKANKTPRPGPGLDSSKNKTDLPALAACWIPNGTKIPLPIALFRNKTLAGSIKILAKGNK